MIRAPQYGHNKGKRRGANPFSKPLTVTSLEPQPQAMMKANLNPELLPYRAGHNLGRDPHRRTTRLGFEAHAGYSKALKQVMARCKVRYRAPHKAQPTLHLWHATKWLGRFKRNPWHPKFAGASAPLMTRPPGSGKPDSQPHRIKWRVLNPTRVKAHHLQWVGLGWLPYVSKPALI